MNAIHTKPHATKEEALVSLLQEVRPRRVLAASLMFQLDLRQEQTGFVEFIQIVIRARKLAERNGFRLMRSGGTPNDSYWIEHLAPPVN